MSGSRRSRARRLALQALYQLQLAGHDLPELLQQFPDREGYQRADTDYFTSLLSDVDRLRSELDAAIASHGEIPPEQLDPVERAILWLGLAELISHPEVPMRVVLNEAVELAQLYGAEGGHRYVNAVLDKAAAEFRPHGL